MDKMIDRDFEAKLHNSTRGLIVREAPATAHPHTKEKTPCHNRFT